MRLTRWRTLMMALIIVPMTIAAQRPQWNKMSSMVREACRNSMQEGLSDAKESRTTNHLPATRRGERRKMIAFVKLSDDDSDVLTRNGCRTLARYGSLCIAEIPLSNIARLSLDKHVCRIEAQRGTKITMDTTAIIVGALPVQQGIALPQGYTGRGVVVGVQDIGFDLTHPTFWSSDMSRYRVQAMWDQLSTDTIGSHLPAGRDYKGHDALLKIKHPRDGNIQAHGTHTAGTAAGSGAEGSGIVSPYKGIAYDADICLVCNATSNDANLIDPADYYKYTYALDALGFKYIFDYADSVGKPCVINFSEGSQMDFRGDDELYYEMLDSLTGQGHIIVASSGNSGMGITHIRKKASESEKAIDCYNGNDYLGMTTRSRDDFTLSIRLTKNGKTIKKDIPLSKVLALPDTIYSDSIADSTMTKKIYATAYRSCFNSDDIICDWQINRDTKNRDTGWKITAALCGKHEVEAFPTSGAFYRSDGSRETEDNLYSVLSPGSAPSVICVGYTCYRKTLKNHEGKTVWTNLPENESDNGGRMPYSSVGPTYDGRIKPDVMAPGQNIVASFNSFVYDTNPDKKSGAIRLFQYDGRTYGWNLMGGSSMAAPVVTGVIALWLQANPQLTPEDCLDIIAKTSTHYDPSLSYPNIYYGYGQIDAEAGMRLVLDKAAAGIKEIGRNKTADGRIFTLDGRYVGKDAGSLPHGIYIIDGKKIIR